MTCAQPCTQIYWRLIERHQAMPATAHVAVARHESQVLRNEAYENTDDSIPLYFLSKLDWLGFTGAASLTAKTFKRAEHAEM